MIIPPEEACPAKVRSRKAFNITPPDAMVIVNEKAPDFDPGTAVDDAAGAIVGTYHPDHVEYLQHRD